MSHPLATTLGYTAYVSAALLTRADQFILSNLYPPSILFSFKIQIKFFAVNQRNLTNTEVGILE